MTYSGPSVAQRARPVLLRGKLAEDDGSPAGAGRTVSFRLGTQTCIGTTDATGTASCSILVNQTAGPKALTLSFAGDAFYLPSTRSASLVVI